MAEEKKPMATTQQKESQGREYIQESKGNKDNEIKERITITKVEG